MKKNHRTLISTTVVVFILIVIFASFFVGIKLLDISIELGCISSEIRYTEEIAETTPSGWTDEAIARYNSLQEMRAEFTSSSVPFVRWFSNLNTGFKFLVMIPFFVIWILVAYVVYSYFSHKYRLLKKQRNNRHKEQ